MAHDTIVALSSGSPPAGVAVIRVSGSGTRRLVEEAIGTLPEPRRLTLCSVSMDGQLLDRGLVAWFPAPGSFTGEDCAEFQLHGSPAVVRAVLRALTRREGVRLAGAGEFTRRAFENGKLDLTEVEGLGDLIAADTESQRVLALARLDGSLSTRVNGWRETLLDLRAEVEARLDFSDEGDVADSLPAGFQDQLDQLIADIMNALASASSGRIVREGLRVALAGPPNAGKSSLLNALAKSDVAIVTDEPGTTRDVREVPLDLGGRLVVLVDMAGLRDTESKAESEGVRRARNEIADADLVLWLVAPDVPGGEMPAQPKIWRVGTKADLGPVTLEVRTIVSALTGAGVAELLLELEGYAAKHTAGTPPILSRERDVAGLTDAIDALRKAQASLEELELCAEALRRASFALERLLGRIEPEMVLDRLFLGFCIGK